MKLRCGPGGTTGTNDEDLILHEEDPILHEEDSILHVPDSGQHVDTATK